MVDYIRLIRISLTNAHRLAFPKGFTALSVITRKRAWYISSGRDIRH